MTKEDDEFIFAEELANINERLCAIEQSIQNLTVAIQSLTSRSNNYGVVTAL